MFDLTGNAAVPAQPVADSFGGTELARIGRHKRTSAESPRNLPNRLFTLSVAGGSVKGDAHGKLVPTAQNPARASPAVIHRWLPSHLYELGHCFPSQQGSCVGYRMVWSRLDQRRPRGEGAPSHDSQTGRMPEAWDAGQVRTTRRISMTLGRTCLSPLSSNLHVASLR